MQQRFHFISGLPRSGSTLLGAILRQNPRFHAGMSSPVGSLVAANLQMMSSGSELSLMLEEEQKPRILRGLFDAFYSIHRDKEVIFDTNRLWCAKMPLLHELFPGAKVIACVRDVPWVMDSIERLVQKSPFDNTRLFGGDTDRATVYSRVDSLARHDRLVGFPWTALKQAFYGEQADSLLVVEYDLLVQVPEQVLRLIYQFLEEPWYGGHDFDNVEYDAPEFDAALGLSGLHKVRRKVAYEPRKTILPPDLFSKFEGMSFWRELSGSKAHVITANRPQPIGDAPQGETP